MKLVFCIALLLYFNYGFSQSAPQEIKLQTRNENLAATHADEDSIKMWVDYAEVFKGYSTASSYVWARGGYNFIGLYVHVFNPTNKTIEVNLKEVYLLDSVKKIKYDIHKVMGTGTFAGFKKSKIILKPATKEYRKLVFGIPDDLHIRYLLYHHLLIPVNTRIHKL